MALAAIYPFDKLVWTFSVATPHDKPGTSHHVTFRSLCRHRHLQESSRHLLPSGWVGVLRPGPHRIPGVERHFLNQGSRSPFLASPVYRTYLSTVRPSRFHRSQTSPARQVSIEAINKHLAQTSGRMRRRQGHRPADPRRRRLARFATSRRARQHRAHAASTLPAGAELDRPFWLGTSGNICAATFSATAFGTPTRRSSTRVAMPGTP